MTEKHPNKLINETSPYLLQHAYNPVQWNPWCEEALDLAKKTGKPILVSIGYAACHWCHVMERESFENEETARYMNEHFINIKIDREERPDLDHIYMDAVQAMTGSGGWPLNVFLTPDGKPFYGGTYFPPVKAYNRSSWKDVLMNIQDAWENRREEMEAQADKLVNHISLSGNLIGKSNTPETADAGNNFTTEHCDIIAANILKSADKIYGGFGAAPKFPQTFSIQYLIAYGHYFNNEDALKQAGLSLRKMLEGGIYDHLAGGMSRYSTDRQWLAPHFEKMLYDNALLVSVLADAYQLTDDIYYADAIHKTLGFFIREMKHHEGGFFAALDADSEGVEGKFYVWDKKEIDEILCEDSGLYCKWFSISEKGNWEEKNILHISENESAFAVANNMDVQGLKNFISKCNKKLLVIRNNRPRPLTDDKILLGWNALLITSFCKAFASTGKERYRTEAIELFDFITDKFSVNGMVCMHTYKNNQARYPAFLDDYAYLIQACIQLQEITSNQQYLIHAQTLTQYVTDNFEDTDSGYYYYTHAKQTDVITRKIEFYDGAVPSGNSIMAENLYYLSVVFENSNWFNRAQKITTALTEAVVKYPTSFAVWALLILKRVIGINEIVVTGNDIEQIHKEMLRLYLPDKIFQSSSNEVNGFPLLKDKNYVSGTNIYLCRNFACMEPVNTINQLKLLLKKPVY